MAGATGGSALKANNTRRSQIGSEIASIESQLSEIESKAADIQVTLDGLKQQAAGLRRQKGKLDQEMAGLNKWRDLVRRGLVVSEHAMLRYVHRVIGVSEDELCAKVLPPEVGETIKMFGDGEYPVGETHRVRIKDGVVVTVLA